MERVSSLLVENNLILYDGKQLMRTLELDEKFYTADNHTCSGFLTLFQSQK